jgi:hypothetical protein
MYDDAHYAGTRLNNTVVLLKRKPVYVVNITRDLKAVVTYDVENRGHTFVVDCSKLNVVAFDLGFINKGDNCAYMARRSLRHDWRQGLRPNNVHMNGQRQVEYKDIAQVLRQRYPTFEAALGRVKAGDVSGCAWCQDFALKADGNVVWRYEAVGKFDDKGYITLDNNFRFLYNQIMETTYACCREV